MGDLEENVRNHVQNGNRSFGLNSNYNPSGQFIFGSGGSGGGAGGSSFLNSAGNQSDLF